MKIFVLLSFLALIVLSCNANNEQNVALQKPVLAKAKCARCLTDGNYRSTIIPQADVMPIMVVDLQDIYEISKIRLHAQNEVKLRDAGINVPFTLHTWDEHISKCDMAMYYPWKVVEENLEFVKRGEMIEITGPIRAQYIIVMPKLGEDPFAQINGLHIGELEAFGTMVKNGYREEQFDQDPSVTNRHLELRHELLDGQPQLWVDQGYMEYKLSAKYGDVALAWHHNRINTMAVKRDEARVIMMAGVRGMQRLISSADYDVLRNNFRRWLNPTNSQAEFVSVSKSPKLGDIILITRADQFDVNAIHKQLVSGQNSAIFGYIGSTDEPSDCATQLMKKLEIGHHRHDGQYMGRDVPLTNLIESPLFVPLIDKLDLGLRSWKYFKSNDFVVGFSTEEVESKEVQDLVKKLVERYRNFFTYHEVCTEYPYKHNNDTDLAMINFNRILLLQNGDRIVVAPGVSKSPGHVHSSMKPTSYNVTFKIDIAGNFFPTGAYAKAGEAFTYVVVNVSQNNLNGYRIRINPQTDFVGKVDGYKRWPIVTKFEDLRMRGTMVSPFGGPIVLQIPGNSELTIRLENVYRYAFLDMRNPETRRNWDSEVRKYRGVPYSMIMGDNMISMVSTDGLSRFNLQNITFSVNLFDNFVKIMHNYRGTKHEESRVEVFVTDDQLSAGWGHSGYPWMGYRSWGQNFLDAEMVKTGRNIGMAHELGHNLQVRGMTLKNGGEVTNNVFISVGHKYLLGLDAYDRGARPGCTAGDEEQLIECWKGETYIGVKESYYNYFGRHFTPALVGNVFHLVNSTKEPLQTEEQRVNFWIKHMCTESGYDLIPFHRLWSFPIDDATVATCGAYRCWFPNDHLTQQVPELVQKLKEAHGKTCCSANPKKVQFKRDIMRGINQVKPQSIFFH